MLFRSTGLVVEPDLPERIFASFVLSINQLKRKFLFFFLNFETCQNNVNKNELKFFFQLPFRDGQLWIVAGGFGV